MRAIKKYTKSLSAIAIALLIAVTGSLVLKSAFAATGFTMQPNKTDVNNGDPFSVSFFLSTSTPVDTVSVCVNFPSTVTMTGVSYNNSAFAIPLPTGPAQCTSSISFSRSNIPAISGNNLLLGSASFRMNTSSGAVNITYSTGTDALNNGNTTSPSTAGTSIQAHATPTPSPTNVSATAQSSSSASVSWTIPSDASPIKHFHVYRNGVEVNSTAPTATSYSDTGLAPSTAYTYGVQTEDGNGRSSIVNASNVETQSDQPAGCTSNCTPNPTSSGSKSSGTHKTTTTQPKLDTTPSAQPVTVSQPGLVENPSTATSTTTTTKKTSHTGLAVSIAVAILIIGGSVLAILTIIKRHRAATEFSSTTSSGDLDVTSPSLPSGPIEPTNSNLPGSEIKPEVGATKNTNDKGDQIL